jgi:hypothetical protein
MNTLHTPVPQAAGLRQGQTQFPSTQSSAYMPSTHLSDPNAQQRPVPSTPARDVDDDDWTCCRSID